MKRFLILFAFACNNLLAQDKLFFINGTAREGYLVSIGKDYVFFKASDTSQTNGILKSDLLMVEDVRGVRHVFAKQEPLTDTELPPATATRAFRNLIGAQPLGIFTGRATFAYEHMNEKGNVGIVIPLSLTFDPIGTIYKVGNDTTGARAFKRTRGINFVSGVDVNFYVGNSEAFRFFIGPRLRYGKDIFLNNTEGYTMQTQFGWKIGEAQARFVQHISLGFGFVRVISISYTPVADPKQSYGWYSVNYRISFKW